MHSRGIGGSAPSKVQQIGPAWANESSSWLKPTAHFIARMLASRFFYDVILHSCDYSMHAKGLLLVNLRLVTLLNSEQQSQ